MTVAKRIPGRTRKDLQGLLKGMMEKGAAEALLAPARNRREDSYAYFLMERGKLLDSLEPLPPIMSSSAARVLRYLTVKGPLPWKTLAILRPCELRAVTELQKLSQVHLDGLVTISFDCPGAFPLKDFFKGSSSSFVDRYEKALSTGQLAGQRDVCEICVGFTGEGADVQLGFVGVPEGEFWAIANTDAGQACLDLLDADSVQDLEGRGQAINKEKERRREERKRRLVAFRQEVEGPQKLLTTLENCLNCHNCMRVCPVCFCQECYFESSAFRAEADRFLARAARRKGGLCLPPDMLLFHLGRMTHMSVSCVSCGACQDACPADIPVSLLFSLVGTRTQELFEYEPGRDLSEPIPYMHFEREEFQEMEAPYLEVREERAKA